MAWSPLAGGRLFTAGDESAARVRAAVDGIAAARSTTADVIALAFLLRHPSRMHPVIGTGRVERIEAAVRAMELQLSRMSFKAEVSGPDPGSGSACATNGY